MGIDFVEGKINPDQVELDPILVRDVVATMEHGEEAYIPSSYYWVDDKRKMWIDVNAPRYSPDEVPDAVEEVCDLLVRCIRIKTNLVSGYIIDASYCNMPPDGEDINRHDIKTGDGYDSGINRSSVIGWVGTPMELSVLENILNKQFEVKIGDCAIRAAYRAMGEQESD